ncbi:MAG: single-stranded DNA-binding protein [Spirochaetes bacterium]|nr:single-stranded DNA-binding protein [Spirochaetota bacterium]MBN2769677.1 single-stranded DNA-binding protein [Spirochaetota bacterium]
MSNLSNVTIEGFVTQEPLLKKTKTGKDVCNFSLAINHNSEKGEEAKVSFIDIETWEKTALSCAERVHKGKRVIVMGNIRQDRWQAEDGSPRSKIKIVGNQVRYLTAKKDEELLEKSTQQKAFAV